jgi:hypothetical protein
VGQVAIGVGAVEDDDANTALTGATYAIDGGQQFR